MPTNSIARPFFPIPCCFHLPPIEHSVQTLCFPLSIQIQFTASTCWEFNTCNSTQFSTITFCLMGAVNKNNLSIIAWLGWNRIHNDRSASQTPFHGATMFSIIFLFFLFVILNNYKWSAFLLFLIFHYWCERSKRRYKQDRWRGDGCPIYIVYMQCTVWRRVATLY